MSEKIRVLVADDHAILRSGLRLLIDAEPDLAVVGEAGDFGEAIRLATSLHPDVVTLDLSMPGGSGLASIERLRAAAPAARVLVLTMHDDPAYVRSALAVGASVYVAKSAADDALIGAIRSVHRGRLFVDVPGVGGGEVPGPKASGETPLERLSAREREVLGLLALGHTNRAIAERLGLSTKTVETYRARVLEKLGLETRADLTRVALDLGILPRPPD